MQFNNRTISELTIGIMTKENGLHYRMVYYFRRIRTLPSIQGKRPPLRTLRQLFTIDYSKEVPYE